jgi:hypothetical protein
MAFALLARSLRSASNSGKSALLSEHRITRFSPVVFVNVTVHVPDRSISTMCSFVGIVFESSVDIFDYIFD